MPVTVSKTHTAQAESESRQDNKTFLYKVYDADGNYLKTWNDVVNDPTFTWPINGGQGEMTVRLARKYDAFGEEEDVDLQNEVRIYVRDDDNATDLSPQASQVHNMDTYNGNGLWYGNVGSAGGDAINIRTKTTNYKEGVGGVGFDVDVSVSVLNYFRLINKTMTSFALPCHPQEGKFTFMIYIPNVTWINAMAGFNTFFRIGSSNTDYWKYRKNKTDFVVGWNYIEFDWSHWFQTIGTPNRHSIDYLDMEIDYTVAQTDMNNLVLDDIRFLRDSGGTINFTERLYTGYIAGYTPAIEGSKEYVDITLMGYVATLNDDVLEDGADNTEVAYSTKDPNFIIDNVITEYGGKITAHEGNADVGIDVSYTFNTSTHLDAINKAKDMADEGWYWYVTPDNYLRFKSRSATADHLMIVGRHVVRVTLNKRIENVKNVVLFIGGDVAGTPLYKEYTRSSSITAYGRRVAVIHDERVTLAATAQRIADKLLDEQEDPEIRMELLIEDNNGQDDWRGYDIESFAPGDTIALRNFKAEKSYTLWDTAIWDTDKWDYSISFVAGVPMQIVNIQYHPDHVILEVSSRPQPVENKISEMIDQLEEYRSRDNPSAPS